MNLGIILLIVEPNIHQKYIERRWYLTLNVRTFLVLNRLHYSKRESSFTPVIIDESFRNVSNSVGRIEEPENGIIILIK